ncbi:MAG: hypothetical protein SFX72_03475 [Isosphaeraceae bacterium]|nr:hypothetical protein [Isosphaeraceae bacterium]
MLWRSLSLVRAWSAAGMMTLVGFGLAVAGDTPDPVPGREVQGETVRVLDGMKSGELTVEATGRGQSRVHLAVKNNSGKRLNVILPPGLVASTAVGQGGLQNMGLGAPGNNVGAFGQFRNGGGVGFRSVDVAGPTGALPVAAGQTVEIDLPAVCLNFGLTPPSAKDKLTLVDVEEYSRDARVRSALRSLALLGTSQGTAQAVMWNVANNVSFEMMLQKGEKVVNRHEVALAARFVDALDAASTGAPIDAAYLTEARIFVSVVGRGALEKDARRLAADLEGLRVMGLPVRVASTTDLPKTAAPALHLILEITDSKVGKTSAKLEVRGMLAAASNWTTLGRTTLEEAATLDVLPGADLARALDKTLAVNFVSVKPTKRTAGSTTFKVENRLPFTLAGVTLAAGNSAGAPSVTVSGVGIGPARSGTVSLPAATASVERVELNGL